MPIFKLEKDLILFPPTGLADHDGLLAYGGDLSVERLLCAYRNGIFPWYNPDEPILWWSPHRRFLIFPNEIHVSRSMKKTLRRGDFDIKMNADFGAIMKNCRKLREGKTWISDDMEVAYNALFDAGHALCVGVYSRGEVRQAHTDSRGQESGAAHSLEAGQLVGGLYGVVIGRCFFGESMFSLVPDASKIALIHLCRFLAERDFVFADCQFHTPHLEKMGGRYVSWADYRRLLREGQENL
ncbi:MAG: leucyl/phenylalanyl-tRNA--protein transferase [Defluviitaleaceae bacterium]|nr:leucyl/phenylalanyl-tRNA--protein transferase [Defluviitaleaceae bacterium]